MKKSIQLSLILAFGKLILQSVHRLFQYLEVDEEQREHHRIYTDEIIQLGNGFCKAVLWPTSALTQFVPCPTHSLSWSVTHAASLSLDSLEI